jgi:signal transduction histidine kinase
MKILKGRFSFNRLSITQRLPLLICSLLLSAIVIYGFANYYSLKKATLIIGQDRLTSVTVQLSTTLGQAARSLEKISNATAAQENVIKCLKSGGKEFHKETLDALDKLFKDSSWVSVELLNADMMSVLRSGKSTIDVPVNIKNVISITNAGPDSTKIGELYKVKNNVYFPIISAMSDKKHIIGYILSWKSLLIPPKSVSQFSQLVGIGANFYVGNADGTLWTDLVKPLPGIPFKINKITDIINYTDPDGQDMLANAQIIGHTKWLMIITFPKQIILNGLNNFLNWITIIGIILMAIGILATWIMSRNITKPLNQLTAAATTVSLGNYTVPVSVNVHQDDELGKLARAFNMMTEQVYQMYHDLEDKVTERTAQLENVNSELEAFSYSVSHDLRTPLRAVNGYAIMLKEDYEKKLDAEGNRIIQNIITNAKMMGQLIDDLLSFSRLGKKELICAHVDMQLLVKSVVDELLQNVPENKYRIITGLLPPAEADLVMIKQVLLNLIGNAIKYAAKKDDPEIEIGFKDEETKTTYYIKDNGAGFDMAYANKLFGVFQRLHSQEEFEGSGVGLALVKRIIDKHKGEIWAEGFENAGATFYFSLPKN